MIPLKGGGGRHTYIHTVAPKSATVCMYVCTCRRGFRGRAPAPPVESHNDKGGGGTFSSRSFSTDC